ncbi:MAG: [protein-PII] uridylyltransferase [bacterium]|nr:[protein-PII] uridylyltransferase [bacterium]
MAVLNGISEHVLAAREELAEGRAKLRILHDQGAPGAQVCNYLTDLVDRVLLSLFEHAADSHPEIKDLLKSRLVLIPNGGYGRRDVSPFSDVDLMVLHRPGDEAQLEPFIRTFSNSLYDAKIDLGLSVRTIKQACTLALNDATIFTSMAESRFLAGSEDFFDRFQSRYRRFAKANQRRLVELVIESRREERRKFGETIFLLEPNVKRSAGALRGIQLLRWVGFARYRESDPTALHRAGILSTRDRNDLRESRELLLRVRNELHFHAGKSQDVLNKDEQKRIAEKFGYEGDEVMLPVEYFMRDYFSSTTETSSIVDHFVEQARAPSSFWVFCESLISHLVEGDFRVTMRHIGATKRGLEKLRGNLPQVMKLMDLANHYDRRIDHRTWHAIRDSMRSRKVQTLEPEVIERFLSLLSHTARLPNLIRRLHELRVLEQIIPPMRHARCLLQFNHYHKYTVDEHTLRAMKVATSYLEEDSAVGQAYREIKNLTIFHLAILMHDLGKGFAEDHSDVGARMCREIGPWLNLSSADTELLEFLVQNHLLMSRIAQQRDINDDRVVLQFASDVETPERLRMLFVLTCADVTAVGPGFMNKWRYEMLAVLYRRTMRHVRGGDSPDRSSQEGIDRRRIEIREAVETAELDLWWEQQVAQLPGRYIFAAPRRQIVNTLKRLKSLAKDDVAAWGVWLPEKQVTEYTVGAFDTIAPGIFYRLTGVFSSAGLEVFSAEIDPLADGLVLDRFHVQDCDYEGEPPQSRIDAICEKLRDTLINPTDEAPRYRKVYGSERAADQAFFRQFPTRIRVDTTTSEDHTLIDVFAHDRQGLLYDITRAIFDCNLRVHVAKIGTYLDQVVDVFYVTDVSGEKVTDEDRIHTIRESLIAAIEPAEVKN